MFSYIGDIPNHQYVWVDTKFTHDESIGFVRAVWFGLVSYPGRAWGLNVMFESGAVYRGLPPHAIAFSEHEEMLKHVQEHWSIEQAQTWDCYGTDFTTIEYKYLRGLSCKAKCQGVWEPGDYLFTAAPFGDGFTACPEQGKEFAFIRTGGNRLTIQPTNHIVFSELSFTDPDLVPKGLKRQVDVWCCEK